MHWIVYTYRTVDGKLECHAYGAFDNSADDQAHKPFDETTAKQLAASIEANIGGRPDPFTAMALPLEETLQPGV